MTEEETWVQPNPILHTVTAGGFTAIADAWACDKMDNGLYFMSLVGPHTSIQAIAAAIVKKHPDTAYFIKGTEATGFEGNYMTTRPAVHTEGTWTVKHQKLPRGLGWHGMVYTKMAEYEYNRSSFVILTQDLNNVEELHFRFIDKRSPLPLHPSWATWLFDRGLLTAEIRKLESTGIYAYLCTPNFDELRKRISTAVRHGELTT